MKLKLKMILVFMILFITTLSAPVFAEKIDWHDYETGKRLSENSGKKLYIYFYTNSCPWCKKMEKETLGSEKIAAYMNKNFIAVKVNAQKEMQPTRRFQVGPVPTNIFIEPDIKTIIYKRPGYIPEKIFLNIMEAIKLEKYK